MEKLLAFAFLMVALASNGMVSGAPSADSTSHSSLLSLSQANSDFALRLYKQIAAQPTSASKNIFFSPLSVSTALSVLSLGAQGNTLSQIMRVLGYSNITNNDAVSLGELYRQLLERVNNLTSGIDIGNSLHIQRGQNIYEKFLREARELYNVTPVAVNFLEQQTTKDQINAYVSSKTNGRISNFLTDPVSSDTVMLLLNYIVFQGEWLKPFNANNTYESDFHVDDSRTVKVQMMRRDAMLYSTYAKDLSSDVLLIEYVGNTSLLILLPKSGKLEEVERKLTVQRFYQILMSMEMNYVDVRLPKMTLKTSYKLTDILYSMGIKDALSDSANFSGISKQLLKLSEVRQKAELKVDEKGTNASAITQLQMTLMSVPQKFICNRPFLLLIADNYIKSVIFAGRVVNPTA